MGPEKVVLVTGAGGFIGRQVCAQLRRANFEHIGLDQQPREDAVTGWQACDITDSEALGRVFGACKVGAVIHLAAVLPSASRSNPSLATRVNIVGSTNLLEAAAHCGVERFVLASSMSVYGCVGTAEFRSEQDPAAPTDVYGAAKRYVEIYGETLAKNRGLRFTALRIATVVGPGARNTASPWRSEIFEKLATGTSQEIVVPFRHRASLSLVHVEDVARMLILLAQQDRLASPIYNTPAETWPLQKLKEFIETLDRSVAVELGSSNSEGTPPLADGARFVRDFAFHLPSLADRLVQTVKRTCLSSTGIPACVKASPG